MTLDFILLAAGLSRRFGPDNKLLALVAGEPLVVHSARQLSCASPLRALTIVVSPNAAALTLALEAAPLSHKPRFVINTNAAAGIGTSIAAGIGSLAPDVTAALISPGDMPLLGQALIEALIRAYLADGGQRPTFPVLSDGTQMNPVIWPQRFFGRLAALDADVGGKAILASESCCAVPVSEAHLFTDIDTPDDLARYLAEDQLPVGKSVLSP